MKNKVYSSVYDGLSEKMFTSDELKDIVGLRPPSFVKKEQLN